MRKLRPRSWADRRKYSKILLGRRLSFPFLVGVRYKGGGRCRVKKLKVYGVGFDGIMAGGLSDGP